MRPLYKPKASTKAAPAKAARRRRAPRATAAPVTGFNPVVRFEPVVVPTGDGNFQVRPGKPIVTEASDEIGTAEFARLTKISQDHAARLCDLGVIQCRRKSPRARSSYLIPRSEVERFKTADAHERPAPKGTP